MHEIEVVVKRLLRSPAERAVVWALTGLGALVALVVIARFPRAVIPVVPLSGLALVGIGQVARRLLGGRESADAEEFRGRLARDDYRDRAHPAVADALERLAREANALVTRFDRPDYHPDLRERTLAGVEATMRRALRDALPWYREVGGKKKEFAARVDADPEPEAVRWMEGQRAELSRLAADLDGPSPDPLASVRQDLTLRREAERELDGL